MTYEDLQVYVNNQYINAGENDMLSAEVVIEKSDYFNLLEICHDYNIKCYPFSFGFNSVIVDFTKNEKEPDVFFKWLNGFDETSDDLIRVILEWDEILNDEEITIIWDENIDDEDDIDEESE